LTIIVCFKKRDVQLQCQSRGSDKNAGLGGLGEKEGYRLSDKRGNELNEIT
jgi:hypothetical protein